MSPPCIDFALGFVATKAKLHIAFTKFHSEGQSFLFYPLDHKRLRDFTGFLYGHYRFKLTGQVSVLNLISCLLFCGHNRDQRMSHWMMEAVSLAFEVCR